MEQAEVKYDPGMRIIVRGEEWMVKKVETNSLGNQTLYVIGLSQLVKDYESMFLVDVENDIEIVDPAKVTLVPDDSAFFRKSKVYIESQWRSKIPTDNKIHIGNKAAMDLMSYQLEPAQMALNKTRQRIVTEEGIATICLEPNAVTADFGTHNSKMFSTFKKTRFLFQILYKSATLYLKYIRIIIRRTDELEIHLRQSMENSELFNLLDLQKSLTYFSTSLRSNSIVLERLLRLRNATQSQHLIKVYEEDEDLLDDVIIEYKQAVEMVEMYSHILNSMMEVFASIISNNLNLVMKFLASVTIILAIPTLISGLWGMNVPVPFAENPFGFLIVISLAACIAIGTAFLLWKKRMF